MGAIAAALERLLTSGANAICERCGGPMVVESEERVMTVPPVFDLTWRCSRCGALMRIRQVVPHFE